MLRTAAKRAAWGIGGATVVGGTTLTAYAYSNQGAGFRREVHFWRRVAPVVFDYYWKASSSSPLVKYQRWKRKRQRQLQKQQNCETTTTTTTTTTTVAEAATSMNMNSTNNNNDNENVDYEYEYEKEQKQQTLKQLHETHAPDILQVMLELKGLYVKLGQVLSVTALPVPEPYRVLFRTLQSDVPGWEEFDTVIRPTLESELQIGAGGRRRSLEQIFDHIDPIPCGAASIGQAHRARLKHKPSSDRSSSSSSSASDDGDIIEDVIVKVQYPDASWQVPADIQCVGDFLKICVWAGVVDESSAKLSFDEFSRQFLAELDYERERQNLKEVYESSLDPSAPYLKRNVVIPKVYDELCTKKVITMTYLPGPKLEEEARRQLAILGIDTTSKKGIADVVKDAAKDAANPEEPESGELVRRVTKRLEGDDSESGVLRRRVTRTMNVPSGTATTAVAASRSTKTPPFSWKVTASRIVGQLFGLDSILWVVRRARQLLLWSQAVAVTSIQAAPRAIVPISWNEWAHVNRTAAAQAERLSLTEAWIDALFDVHGHQVFNLGLFNADPHPGNILIVEEEKKDRSDGTSSRRTSSKLGLIDYGQCKRLTPEERVRIARLVLSVANSESDLAVATAFRDLGITTKNDSTEFLAKFGRLMFGPLKPEHLNHEWHMRLHKLDRVVYFPNELSMVYRTSLLLRGLAVSLQQNYSISEQWKDHAQEAVDRYQ